MITLKSNVYYKLQVCLALNLFIEFFTVKGS